MIYHTPVLLKESIDLLNLKKDGVYVDATLGGGGHSEAILQNSLVKHVYAFDRDEEAIEYASQRLQKYGQKLTIIKANFEEIRTQLALKRVKSVDGILFDLGVSSHQLDEASRGFSFERDGILDMRMDQSDEVLAKDVLNNATQEELTRIFRDYGEEKHAYQIAHWICSVRKINPINNTKDLSTLIDKNMRGNPAFVIKTKARIFQALRIYVNRELEALETTLEDSINLLNPGGRIVVIAYHSLEDRIVKTNMSKAAQGCICPKTVLKCVCNQTPKVKILTGKSLRPSMEEQIKNSRSRSARLRAAEKI